MFLTKLKSHMHTHSYKSSNTVDTINLVNQYAMVFYMPHAGQTTIQIKQIN